MIRMIQIRVCCDVWGCTEAISFVTVFPYDWMGCFYFIFGFLAMFKYIFSWVNEKNRRASSNA